MLVYSPDALHRQDWAWQKPGASSCIQASYVGASVRQQEAGSEGEAGFHARYPKYGMRVPQKRLRMPGTPIWMRVPQGEASPCMLLQGPHSLAGSRTLQWGQCSLATPAR